MNNPASSETLFGAVKQWVVSTFWWMVAMLVGPVVLLVSAVLLRRRRLGAGRDSEELAMALPGGVAVRRLLLDGDRQPLLRHQGRKSLRKGSPAC